MKINLLDDTVINQIAAGEVVERPASVVRELVDNAIDAGSTDVTVYLEDGGKHLIRVVDNGCGMAPDDARLACERHATSKIVTAEELNDIKTMGFRGEALSSISSVSRLRLITRTADELAGIEVVIDGGVLRYAKAIATPVGTDMRVANLFFNVPARKKFLKQAATEEQRVKQWLLQSSIAHPNVRYRLEVDGKNIINLPVTRNMIERARGIFRGSSVTFEERYGALKITGLLCHPAMAQVDTKALVIFINNRLVSDKYVVKAIREGFSSTLKDSEYPLGFVSVEMPACEVDVNVHPQKSEVRFRNGGDVFQAVREVVRKSVQNFNGPVIMAPSVTANNYLTDNKTALNNSFQPVSVSSPVYNSFSNKAGNSVEACSFNNGDEHRLKNNVSIASSAVRQNMACPNLTLGGGDEDKISLQVSNNEQVKTCSEPYQAAASHNYQDVELFSPHQAFAFSKLRYIGQTLNCFLLCELDNVFYVVDMHAAHERCNYNKIRMEVHEKNVSSQFLLVPQSVELTESGVLQCLQRKDMLKEFGFEIEQFGPTTLLIRSVPTLLVDTNLERLFKEIAALEDEMDLAAIERVIDFIAARIACHASIRSGDKVTREEVYALFADLDKENFNSACPHGRPVITAFKRQEIEKWFGRDK